MPSGPNITKLYDKLFKLKDTLDSARALCDEVIAEAQQFGGEIARVIPGQITKYTIPTLEKLLSETNTPGAIIPLVVFLDNIPLGQARAQKTDVLPPPETQSSPQVNPQVNPQKMVKAAENKKLYYLGRG